MTYKTTPWCEGNPESKICVIAEAPAKTEMIMNRPLVGEAGKIFNELLRQAGIARSDIHIQNFSRVPIKDASEVLHDKGKLKGKLNLRGQEMRADLLERLKETKANVYVTMGNVATSALTDDARITKVRGSPMRSPYMPGHEILPTPHPASCLPWREFTNRYLIISDLRKAKKHSETPGIKIPDRNLIIDPTYLQTLKYLNECFEAKRIAFDIETINREVSCISFALSPRSGICIPIHNTWSEREEYDIWRMIERVLTNPRSEKIGSGIVTYDIPFLFLRNKFLVRGKILDTVTAHRILYPDFPARLEFLLSLYTDEPYYKDDYKQYAAGAIKDIEQFWLYSAKDSTCAYEVWEKGIEPEFDLDIEYAWMYRDTMEVVDPVLYMGLRGVLVDKEHLNALNKEISGEITELEKELNRVAGQVLNYNSPKQCIKYFYETKGIKPYISRATKKPTVDDKALSRIIRKHNLPEARLVQRLRNLGKLRSTYLEVSFDEDGRMRSTYDPRGTTTSRLSSRATPIDTGMNMQNVDPRFKGFILPD